MKKISQCLLVASFLFVFSCSEDDGNQAFQASEQELRDFFSDEVVEALEEVNFVINSGANPPSLEGVYFASPNRLTDSNIPNDGIGEEFPDLRIAFSNQDNDSNEIDFNGTSLEGGDPIESFFGAGSSFISGSENAFSVFSIIEGENLDTNARVEIAYAISGEITNDAIRDFEIAIIMLDDRGDPFNQFIENGQGRRLVDDDGTSERTQLTNKNGRAMSFRGLLKQN